MRHGEPKTEAELATEKMSKSSKSEKGVDCLKAHGSGSEKYDTWAKDTAKDRTLTLQIPTMQILSSQILCVGKIGSRPDPGA